jgi:3-deoxy-7-phosphoheptulonate synthase/chorismate mutase
LEQLREAIRGVNLRLLELLAERGRLVQAVQELKTREGLPTYAPEREQAMLDELVAANPGPFAAEAIRGLFKEIFRASVRLMEGERDAQRIVRRAPGEPDRTFVVGTRTVGAEPIVIAGPCAVEDEAQLAAVAAELRTLGVGFMRGGTFKARTSPYAFQGLGVRGLALLRDAAQRHGLASVSEVTDQRMVERAAACVDVLQIGSRNMYNYDLLREVGGAGRPVLLKRGLAATIDEFLWAAEYLALHGAENVILCERGIRTFETQTRNTLDISAVALLRRATRLPVIVDVSHAAGRKDILAPLARAALAAGAQGIMVEVHPEPARARSDSLQQLDFAEFRAFLEAAGLAANSSAASAARLQSLPEPATSSRRTE